MSEDSFRRLLDQSLTFDEARDILRYKKKCGEFSCEVELLDCVSAMVNKRHQLLPEVVDFAQMHTAEVDSVLRYCMDVLRFEKTDAMPAEILEIHRDFWIQVRPRGEGGGVCWLGRLGWLGWLGRLVGRLAGAGWSWRVAAGVLGAKLQRGRP